MTAGPPRAWRWALRIITAKPASSFPEVATPEDSPARRALAERRIAATREKIAKVPELAAAWGPNGLEYARALDPGKLRKAGFLESEIEVQVEFKEALLEYYAKRPDGTRD